MWETLVEWVTPDVAWHLMGPAEWLVVVVLIVSVLVLCHAEIAELIEHVKNMAAEGKQNREVSQ